jgi:Lon protease-like protein
VSTIERYRTTAELPTDLAVFPLLGCILLPRASLPLNIFEPRYLRMIDDVIGGDRLLGIIQPVDQGTGGESPSGKQVSLRTVGCVGRVTAFEEHNDGRMTIVLTGVARFDTLAEVEGEQPYRRMRVAYDRFTSDLEPGAGEDSIDRDKLIEVLKGYLEARRLQADWGAIERSGSERLINGLSVMSPYGPEEKQALLEATTLQHRADALMTLARMDMAGGSRGGSGPAGGGSDSRRRLQ